MKYHIIAKEMKADSFKMASLDEETRNSALMKIAEALEDYKNEIFTANRKDLEKGRDLAIPIKSRLKFDEDKLKDVVAGIKDLTTLPDPLQETLMKKQLSEDLILEKITCPIGVIGVFFESRPDALVQISALCIKSGNCAILKGGSESAQSNRKLFDIIYEAGVAAGLPASFAELIEDHESVSQLLACNDSIDLIIPRGSNNFVQYIMNNTKIPVMGHADGICTTYVDEYADIDMAAKLIVDGKTQYVSACNSTEMVLVHKSVDMKALLSRITETSPVNIAIHMNGDYKEYLDYEMSIRKVEDVAEAISLINKNGSHHTDAIITEDANTAERFMANVDSAGVYWNASTRFADGYRYGFGAEVGISTGKIHARGPVGLQGLVTYKYKLIGKGHAVGDFASDKCSFNFKNLL